jgi:hypothetical protein
VQDDAAESTVGKYFSQAILEHATDIKPDVIDLLGRNDIL